MSLWVIFIVGLANMVLQSLSRNLLFFYAFLFMVCAAIALSLETRDTLRGKLYTVAVLIGGCVLLGMAIYRHIQFGGYVWDYLLIAIETAAALILTLLSLLPDKRKTQE